MQLVPIACMLTEQDGVTYIIIWEEYSCQSHNICLCCVGIFDLLVWYTAISNGCLLCEMQYTKIDKILIQCCFILPKQWSGMFVYQTG